MNYVGQRNEGPGTNIKQIDAKMRQTNFQMGENRFLPQ
jgi:hypothetical protein